jgi:DNA-directed RNA polymerase specialized sigma24 family protein
VGEPFDVSGFDASTRWAEALRGDGPARDEAVFRLRAHLAAAATFALDRRGGSRDSVDRRAAASLVCDAAEAALAAVLADLDRYRGQSAFTTWTAKCAIHEAATAARKRGIASRSPTEA